MIGKIIGNYEITSELAQGGMGAVYRGRHLHLPREVVVKSILLGAFSPSAQDHLRARFRREAFVQSQLDHPNIVRVYEFFAAEENYYLVMEYVSGMSLRDLLARQGPPTPAQAVYLLKQALAALDYAHDFRSQEETDYRHTGVIHRDIKPANILLDAKGRLKITDFGIVKVLGEQTEMAMTQSGFQPGTVEYMSPEQLLGHEIDTRTDLYSLGVTFYEMLTGRLPFRRSMTGSDWEIRKGHIELDPPPILEIRPEIHPELAAIVMRAIRKNPSDRYQSAADILEAVLDYERNYASKEQMLRSPEGKVTQPQTAPLTLKAMKSTMMDEAATLLARPRDGSAPPRESRLEDESATLMKPEESSPARPPAYQAAAALPDSRRSRNLAARGGCGTGSSRSIRAQMAVGRRRHRAAAGRDGGRRDSLLAAGDARKRATNRDGESRNADAHDGACVVAGRQRCFKTEIDNHAHCSTAGSARRRFKTETNAHAYAAAR